MCGTYSDSESPTTAARPRPLVLDLTPFVQSSIFGEMIFPNSHGPQETLPYCGYPALLSSSYFERINDDDDDVFVLSACVRRRISTISKCACESRWRHSFSDRFAIDF